MGLFACCSSKNKKIEKEKEKDNNKDKSNLKIINQKSNPIQKKEYSQKNQEKNEISSQKENQSRNEHQKELQNQQKPKKSSKILDCQQINIEITQKKQETQENIQNICSETKQTDEKAQNPLNTNNYEMSQRQKNSQNEESKQLDSELQVSTKKSQQSMTNTAQNNKNSQNLQCQSINNTQTDYGNSSESTKHSVNHTLNNNNIQNSNNNNQYQNDETINLSPQNIQQQKEIILKAQKLSDQIKSLKNIQMRQQAEKQIITEYLTQDIGNSLYLEIRWAERYTTYLNSEDFKQAEKLQKYLQQGINNLDTLIDKRTSKLKKGLVKDQDFVIINELTWHFLTNIYTGGPLIISQKNKQEKNSQQQQFQEEQQQQNSQKKNSSQSKSSKKQDPKESLKLKKRQEQFDEEHVKSCKNLKKQHICVFGIQNNSFYCYMNSSLQCLLSIPELNDYFIQNKYKNMKNQSKKSLKFTQSHSEIIISMLKLGNLRSYSQNQYQYINPQYLKKQSKKVFDPNEQHDAQEYLRHYLSELQDELTPYVKSQKSNIKKHNKDQQLQQQQKQEEVKLSTQIYEEYFNSHGSIIDYLFCGQLQSSVKCCKCEHISKTFDPFLDISLPIQYSKRISKNQSRQQQRYMDIRDCLEAFFEEEDLCDDYKCEKCKQIGKATRQIAITKTPKYLCIHLKRFKTFPFTSKIQKTITYPDNQFNIQDYCVGNHGPCTYNLVALIEHSGTPDYGHYVAFAHRDNS